MPFAVSPALLTLAALAGVAMPAPPTPLGVWRNPKGTLAVRTTPCGGDKLCGTIVWAAPQALADARDAGVNRLVGTELLLDYRPAGQGSWHGRVYVPDMGRSFPSRVKLDGANQLTLTGCLVGGLFCRSQTWRRVT